MFVTHLSLRFLRTLSTPFSLQESGTFFLAANKKKVAKAIEQHLSRTKLFQKKGDPKFIHKVKNFCFLFLFFSQQQISAQKKTEKADLFSFTKLLFFHLYFCDPETSDLMQKRNSETMSLFCCNSP